MYDPQVLYINYNRGTLREIDKNIQMTSHAKHIDCLSKAAVLTVHFYNKTDTQPGWSTGYGALSAVCRRSVP